MLEVFREPRSQDAFWPVEDTGRKARHRLAGLISRASEPGTVVPGALGGLVAVDGSPSASLRVLADANNVKAVLIDGRVHRGQPDQLTSQTGSALTVGTCLLKAAPAKDRLAQHQAVRQKRVRLMSALE